MRSKEGDMRTRMKSTFNGFRGSCLQGALACSQSRFGDENQHEGGYHSSD
jgi:hypothetical protein